MRRTNTSHVRNEQIWDHRALASAALVTSAHACLVHASVGPCRPSLGGLLPLGPGAPRGANLAVAQWSEFSGQVRPCCQAFSV